MNVAERSSDLNGAMHAIRSGEALAAVYIPENLDRDLLAGRRPQVVIFFNKQFFTPGNVASSSLAGGSFGGRRRLAVGPPATAFTPGPLVVEQYVLTNPALNYAQFLLRAILPTVLHIVIAISGGYAVGSEFGSRSMREWLATAGGSPLTALVGKLAPYFGIFLVMMAVGSSSFTAFSRYPSAAIPSWWAPPPACSSLPICRWARCSNFSSGTSPSASA